MIKVLSNDTLWRSIAIRKKMKKTTKKKEKAKHPKWDPFHKSVREFQWVCVYAVVAMVTLMMVSSADEALG